MFSGKRKLTYRDMINNTPMQTMPKHKPKAKIIDLLETIAPPAERQTKQRNPFRKPATDEEWRSFHKMNEEGMKKAYQSKEGYFKDSNKLYVAGTRDMKDVFDWAKIPLGIFRKSKIYKNIEPIFVEDKAIDYVVGHSAGGSATLELGQNFPNRNITTVTYNAPVFEMADGDKWVDEDKKPLRFAVAGDPVSMLDSNAQTTLKAPDFNMEAVSNIANAYANPSMENAIKSAKTSKFDPLLGLHKMSGSYSSPSTAKDFIKSGIEGLGVAKAIGVM
jgi:hypothetical protein